MAKLTQEQRNRIKGLRRRVGTQLDSKVKFKHNKERNLWFYDCLYYGSGMLYYNDKYADRELEIGDINSSYANELVSKVFPLTSEYEICDNVEYEADVPSAYQIEFDEKYRMKFGGQYNVMFRDADGDQCKGRVIRHKGKMHCWVSNVRMQILTGLYEVSEMKIVRKIKFKEYGMMPDGVKEIFRGLYNEKKVAKKGSVEREDVKAVLNAASYGKMIQNCGDEWGRDPMSILAVFVLDYSTLRMVRLLEKYGDKVVYMDTDSIFLAGEIKEEIGDEIGQMKYEGRGVKCWFYNWKRYTKMYKSGEWETKFSGEKLSREAAQWLMDNGYVHTSRGCYLDVFHHPEYEWFRPSKIEKVDDKYWFDKDIGDKSGGKSDGYNF